MRSRSLSGLRELIDEVITLLRKRSGYSSGLEHALDLYIGSVLANKEHKGLQDALWGIGLAEDVTAQGVWDVHEGLMDKYRATRVGSVAWSQSTKEGRKGAYYQYSKYGIVHDLRTAILSQYQPGQLTPEQSHTLDLAGQSYSWGAPVKRTAVGPRTVGGEVRPNITAETFQARNPRAYESVQRAWNPPRAEVTAPQSPQPSGVHWQYEWTTQPVGPPTRRPAMLTPGITTPGPTTQELVAAGMPRTLQSAGTPRVTGRQLGAAGMPRTLGEPSEVPMGVPRYRGGRYPLRSEREAISPTDTPVATRRRYPGYFQRRR